LAWPPDCTRAGGALAGLGQLSDAHKIVEGKGRTQVLLDTGPTRKPVLEQKNCALPQNTNIKQCRTPHFVAVWGTICQRTRFPRDRRQKDPTRPVRLSPQVAAPGGPEPPYQNKDSP